MSKTMNWPSRVIYIAIALALAFSLVAIAAPRTDADPGLTKWTKVTTPSEVNKTIFPASNLYDFAVGPDGETIYVIGTNGKDLDGDGIFDPALWKSTDGGATWADKTSKIQVWDATAGAWDIKAKLALPAAFAVFTQVAVAPDNEDFLVITGTLTTGAAAVVGSNNGATSFYYTGDMTGIVGATAKIVCMDVSRGVDNVYNVAVGTDNGFVCRYVAGTYWGGSWADATDPAPTKYPGWVASTAVTSVAFSPSWSADKTVLAISTDGAKTWLQTAMWGTHKGWGSVVERAGAVEFKVETLSLAPVDIFPGVTGMALTSDYSGYDAGMRRVYAYVDTDDIAPIAPNGGYLFRIDSTVLSIPCGPTGHPWLASIAYYGTHDEGKTMLGMLGEGAPIWTPTPRACCTGVQVWRTAEPDICCPDWKGATKKPSGQAYAIVAFTPDGKKAYATTQGEGLSDESAFSVSLDDGKCWNQLGLIDTDIDSLSDVAVSPDCSVTYLSSVNSVVDTAADTTNDNQVCGCDSVWMKDANATEYAGVWQRVYHKALGGDWGLLRLSPEHDDGDVVYWGDFGTENIYWASAKGICKWSPRKTTVNVQDFALADDDILYVINNGADIVKWTEAKHDWTAAVDHTAVAGHTIAVLGDNILVGGAAGSVGYSDDGAASFSRQGAKGELGASQVHVAFDSYFEDNDTIYAALTGGAQGVWRWVIDVSAAWKDLKATPTLADMGGTGTAALDVDYYGIVLDNADGNPETDAAHGGVLYAAYCYLDDMDTPADLTDDVWYTGAARCLTPAATPCCSTEAWDFLHAKLTVGSGLEPLKVAEYLDQRFSLEPSSLKICGCLSAATNSNLYAIDNDAYQRSDGKDGSVWTYEDCFAKEGVTLTAVKDGATVAADPCECWNEKFVLEWERLCNVCEYDIQISLDEAFTKIVIDPNNPDLAGVWPSNPTAALTEHNYAPPSGAAPSYVLPEGALDCNTTYWWRVRARYAETTETIRSFWSDKWSFTVAAGPSVAIELTAPDDGATNVVITGIGFTWTSVADATSYDWVLSASADLSSPVESKTGLTGTAYNFTGTLSNDTPYFWQVTAMKDANVFSVSDVSTFTTLPKAPPPPVTPTPIPPLEPTTPIWVWVVIGIGAVLVIVTLVLSFRTRRV